LLPARLRRSRAGIVPASTAGALAAASTALPVFASVAGDRRDDADRQDSCQNPFQHHGIAPLPSVLRPEQNIPQRWPTLRMRCLFDRA
jgi:hypothetical protein